MRREYLDTVAAYVLGTGDRERRAPVRTRVEVLAEVTRLLQDATP